MDGLGELVGEVLRQVAPHELKNVALLWSINPAAQPSFSKVEVIYELVE